MALAEVFAVRVDQLVYDEDPADWDAVEFRGSAQTADPLSPFQGIYEARRSRVTVLMWEIQRHRDRLRELEDELEGELEEARSWPPAEKEK